MAGPYGARLNRHAVASLALSATAFVGILIHEGYRDRAYDDGVGIQTIGFGTTDGVRTGDRITVERALERALTDASRFEGGLKSCVTAPLHQHEYDAFVSLAYNIGPTAFCRSTLVRKLNQQDYGGACAEISRWTFAGGRELPGLVKRRADERRRCEGG